MPPPDPNNFKSAVWYRMALEEAGWLEVGKGNGGRVYHRAGDSEVIKVTEEDDCYLAFADFVPGASFQCVPSLRVVYRAAEWAVTHIEHLQPLNEHNEALVYRWWDEYLAARKADIVRPLPDEWSALADVLWPVALKQRCGFDMKPENAMQRDGTVVFIDPFSCL